VKGHCHVTQTENYGVKLAREFAVYKRIFVSRLDDTFNRKNHLKPKTRKLTAALKTRPTKLFTDLQFLQEGYGDTVQEP
jgi:hypothetical protein